MRYVTRPRGLRPRGDDYDDYDYEDSTQATPSLTVWTKDNEPTGLCDANGDPIYRVKDPIGFRFTDNE